MPRRQTSKEVRAVSPAEFQALNEAALAALQGKYGAIIKIRSTTASIQEILKDVDRASFPGTIGELEYDKGFDRTNPGYDRRYDRDSPGRFFMEESLSPSGVQAGKVTPKKVSDSSSKSTED